MGLYLLENFDITIELIKAPVKAPIGTQPLRMPWITPLSNYML
jgi:hypothetical protein